MLNEAIRRQEILNLKRISFKKINKKRCATKCVFVDKITKWYLYDVRIDRAYTIRIRTHIFNHDCPNFRKNKLKNSNGLVPSS